jgi:hypothetical protein
MNHCQKCGSQISDSAVFCEKCGAKQEKMPEIKICSNSSCKNEMPANMIFCDKCGTKYTAPAAETKTHPAEEAARKTGEEEKANALQEIDVLRNKYRKPHWFRWLLAYILTGEIIGAIFYGISPDADKLYGEVVFTYIICFFVLAVFVYLIHMCILFVKNRRIKKRIRSIKNTFGLYP